MGHGLTERDTMFSVREVPWHGLGTVIQDAPSADDALKLAGLDWMVLKCPVYAKTGSEIGDGFSKASGKVGLIREDTNDVLGIVSDFYRVFQNYELTDFANELVGEDLRYETGGSLFGGQKIYMTAKWQSRWSVADDDIDLYLLLSNGHTGMDAFKVAVTPVRVVCNNTLQAALRRSNRAWSINHYNTLEARVREARNTLQFSRQYMDEFVEYGNRTADQNLTPETVETIIERVVFQTTPQSTAAKTKREQQIREFEACYNAEDLKPYRGTAWALINAASDYETHRQQNQQQLLRRVLNANNRVFDRVVEFVNSL